MGLTPKFHFLELPPGYSSVAADTMNNTFEMIEQFIHFTAIQKGRSFFLPKKKTPLYFFSIRGVGEATFFCNFY